MKKKIEIRVEMDSLGNKEVPPDAYYGIQTVRALENFPISGLRQFSEFIIATAMIKNAAAITNMEVGKLDSRRGNAITKAAGEIIKGRLHDQFVVDVFQAGAGTSHNMNTNEVIANRAIEILGGKKGDYSVIHPNDHVNMSQSTNDVFPTAMRIAAVYAIDKMLDVLKGLSRALHKKGREFEKVIKSGRTHLQDAVPIRLGQEFKAYGIIVDNVTEEIRHARGRLLILGIGGSAVGTGLNTHPQYQKKIIRHLREITGLRLVGSDNLIASMQSMGDFVCLSGTLRLLATELIKIANDLRLMSSGPLTGLSEIHLPAVQPGSSIMPGKVNPVMAEVLNMTAFQVIGSDTVITLASQAGQLELNVMMPVINYNIQQSVNLLTNVLKVFTERCVMGIKANEVRCREYAEKSPGIAAILNQVIGYENAAMIAKEAVSSGRSIRDLVVEKRIMSSREADEILDPLDMTR